MNILDQLKPIHRAASIYYGKGLLFGLEKSVQKWIYKKGLPYKVNGVEFTPWSTTVKLISKDLNYPEVQFSFKLR